MKNTKRFLICIIAINSIALFVDFVNMNYIDNDNKMNNLAKSSVNIISIQESALYETNEDINISNDVSINTNTNTNISVDDYEKEYEKEYANVPFLKDINYDTGLYKKNERNPFFFSDDLKMAKYESYIYPLSYEEILEEDINLKIDLVKQFDEGNLYTLELIQYPVEDVMDTISMGKRYLGYFYVNKDGIYLSSSNMDGYPEEKTAELIDLITNDKYNLLNYFCLVCSDEETEIVDGEWVYKIEVNGDERTFKYYSTYTSGTRAYLLITWKLNKGIVHYVTGDGSMRMHTEFGTDLENQRYEDINYYPWFPR